MESHHIIDVVTAYPVTGLAAAEFIGLLRKLPPRLYSIASSFKANPDEVHLTVAVVRYTAMDRQRKGVASNYLAERVEEDATVLVYVESNTNFRLPPDPNTPTIMIGPGTGVAPFRAFMQEREELGAKGRNWLFFGAPHFTTDFLYQTEWLRYRKTGLLTHIDVAFSRDASEKVYVQHRMCERGKELYAWLQEGAHLYVCGDSKHMAADVHAALLEIIQQEGRLTGERAADYVKTLQKERRYQRDVY
jgi:sulfite reductase (NADPH) flavoprotein alpha-component